MNWTTELPSILLILAITGFVIWSSNKEKGFFSKLVSMDSSHFIVVFIANNSYEYRVGKAW